MILKDKKVVGTTTCGVLFVRICSSTFKNFQVSSRVVTIPTGPWIIDFTRVWDGHPDESERGTFMAPFSFVDAWLKQKKRKNLPQYLKANDQLLEVCSTKCVTKEYNNSQFRHSFRKNNNQGYLKPG